MLAYYPEHEFLLESAIVLNDINNPSTTERRRFQQNYGISPFMCTILWSKLSPTLHKNCRPKHMLYALRFLKTYSTEDVSAVAEGCDEKTFRKWVWYFVTAIGQLNEVSYLPFKLCSVIWKTGRSNKFVKDSI